MFRIDWPTSRQSRPIYSQCSTAAFQDFIEGHPQPVCSARILGYWFWFSDFALIISLWHRCIYLVGLDLLRAVRLHIEYGIKHGLDYHRCMVGDSWLLLTCCYGGAVSCIAVYNTMKTAEDSHHYIPEPHENWKVASFFMYICNFVITWFIIAQLVSVSWRKARSKHLHITWHWKPQPPIEKVPGLQSCKSTESK